MTPLHLSPLPTLGSEETSSIPAANRENFIDEAVVLALVAGPVTQREMPISSELALTVDDMDFAGWSLPQTPSTPAPSKPTPRAANPTPVPVMNTSRSRPAPPIQDEPGLGDPHRGNHRWWLAGLAGAVSTLLFSLLLLSLSSRSTPEAGGTFMIQGLTKTRATPPVEMTIPRKPSPALTDAAH